MTSGQGFPPPPPPPYRGPVPPAGNWFTRGGWWFFVHLFTFGFLTAIPMAQAASRIRRPWPWIVLAVSIVVGVGSFALIAGAPKDAQGKIIDLNDAPAESLAVTLDVDRSVAGAIVQARQAAGRLGSVDDVFAWIEIPVHLWDRIRERGIVVG